MEAMQLVPSGTTKECEERSGHLLVSGFDEGRISCIESEVRHDVIAFLTYLNEVIGEPGRHLHKGMTSSDLVDTVYSLQLRDSSEVIKRHTRALLEVLERRAWEHEKTVCIGRSHGMHAEPTTFGFKLTVLWNSIKNALKSFESAAERASLGKCSGAVGVFSHFPLELEERVCDSLGLSPSPISNQIIQREVFAAYFQALALLATTLEQLVTEIRHLSRTEVGEVSEGFKKGQKGSSAMPHKKNPIMSENVTGLARVVRGYSNSMMESVVSWHERDISHSSVERMVAPDATGIVAFMLIRTREIVEGLVVNRERMTQNLEMSRGAFRSQKALLHLIESGMSREEAYKRVQDSYFGTDAGIVIEGLEDLSPDWYTRRVGEAMKRAFRS
jgi:adenylosuccinate lyase